jgi:uridine phosphorylase
VVFLKSRFVFAVHPQTKTGAQYHIGCKKRDVGRYVFLPGDPDRVPKIAEFWDSAREVSSHREYRIWTGCLDGIRVSACSTGIGGPAAAIAVEELAAIGADTFIRVGTCGALRKEIRCGDLVTSTAAVRLDGTSRQYVQPEYPAVANYEIVLSLIEAAEKLTYRYHVGYTASSDSFYVGQGRLGFKGYLPLGAEEIVETLSKVNVLNFEMEAATIFTLAGIYGLRAGAVCAVYANRITNRFEMKGEEEVCKAAVEAVRILARWDKERKKKGKEYWYPRLSFGR